MCFIRGEQTGKDPAWPEPVARVLISFVVSSIVVALGVLPVPFSDLFRAIARAMLEVMAWGKFYFVGAYRKVKGVPRTIKAVGCFRINGFKIGFARGFFRMASRLIWYNTFSRDDVMCLINYVQVYHNRDRRIRLGRVICVDGVTTVFAVSIGSEALVDRRFLGRREGRHDVYPR